MKYILLVINLTLVTRTIFGGGEWLYYKHYPWVYDNISKEWIFLQGGFDGKIYAYQTSKNSWTEFSVFEKERIADSPQEETQDKGSAINDLPSKITLDLNSSVKLEMIWCSPGTFMMGSPETEAYRDYFETQHQVSLTNGFYLGKYEVTQAQYEAIMKNNTANLNPKPSYLPGNPDQPVTRVTWDDVQVFFDQMNNFKEITSSLPAGWKFTLPTEAQWEYACRAGTTTVYHWGNSVENTNANYSTGLYRYRNVGLYPSNSWGFHDMHGNVWEWVHDWWEEYPTISQIDPKGPITGDKKIIRGGSASNDPSYIRSAKRGITFPSSRWEVNIGFRISFQK